MFLLSTVVLAASIYLAGALPGGAPSTACSNLNPSAGHGSGGAQTDAVPYVFDLSQFDDGNGGYEYTPGQSYTPIAPPPPPSPSYYQVTLSDPSGTMFRGFLVQSRVVADGSIVGTFAADAPNSRLSSCSPSNSAITHQQPTSRVDFASMTMTWNAPPAGTGAIQFAYAVVRRNSGGINVFWADQRSSTLQEAAQVVQSSIATTTDVQSSTTTDVQSSTTTDVQSSTTTDTPSSTTTDAGMTPTPTPTPDGPTPDGGDGTTGSASVLGTSLLFLLLSLLLGATLLL